MKAEDLVQQFYTAFAKKEYNTMSALYHPEATFYDPVFLELNALQVKAMWHMLCLLGGDLEINHERIAGFDNSASVIWHAYYSFSKTGRFVHNIVRARFTFRDNLIYRHEDDFDLWRWSRMALGLSGLLLGWSAPVQNKIRKFAEANLQQFIINHPEYRS